VAPIARMEVTKSAIETMLIKLPYPLPPAVPKAFCSDAFINRRQQATCLLARVFTRQMIDLFAE